MVGVRLGSGVKVGDGVTVTVGGGAAVAEGGGEGVSEAACPGGVIEEHPASKASQRTAVQITVGVLVGIVGNY